MSQYEAEIRAKYPETLVRIFNRIQMPSDLPYEQLLLQREDIPAKETDKIYQTLDARRIKKSQLLVLRDMEAFIPQYEVYCLPGQEEQAAELIRQRIETEVGKMLAHFGSIHASALAGYQMKSPKDCVDYTMSKSASARRKSQEV